MSKTLPEFQKFLVARKLVPEKHMPHYAHWVSKFLSFANKHEEMNVDARVPKCVFDICCDQNQENSLLSLGSFCA